MSTVFAVAAPSHAQEPGPTGYWRGAFVRENSTQEIVLRLAVTGKTVECAYSIPDVGITDEPCEPTIATDTGFVLRLHYSRFALRYHAGADQITGLARTWNPAIALHLRRIAAPDSTWFRQRPAVFTSLGATLRGTLFLPATRGPHTAVVVVHGAGPSGRHQGSYLWWREYFVRRGIAVLLYDKRGSGASAAGSAPLSIATLATDAAAAADWLSRSPDVQTSKVAMMGISQGGWVAPLAAQQTVNIRALILNVGSARTVWEQEIDRVEWTLRADGVDSTAIRAAVAYTQRVLDVAAAGGPSTSIAAATAAAAAADWASVVQLATSDQLLDDWRRERFNPAPTLQRTVQPLLALLGERDVMVPPATNATLLEQYLRRAGNHDVSIRIVPDADHALTTSPFLLGGVWKWPAAFWVWPKRSPIALAILGDWLKSHGWSAIP